ncbi:MAG: sulfatase-like hydrolase/transferase, partial [Opitutales bacterium]
MNKSIFYSHILPCLCGLVSTGSVRFDRSGLHLLRFGSQVEIRSTVYSQLNRRNQIILRNTLEGYQRMRSIDTRLTVIAFFLASSLASAAFAQDAIKTVPSSTTSERPSVLFLNIDDWNDWNSVLKGHPQAITPNLERFAERSITFTRAICSSPVCFPSRTSLFSGLHPSRTGAKSNPNGGNRWRSYVPDA